MLENEYIKKEFKYNDCQTGLKLQFAISSSFKKIKNKSRNSITELLLYLLQLQPTSNKPSPLTTSNIYPTKSKPSNQRALNTFFHYNKPNPTHLSTTLPLPSPNNTYPLLEGKIV